MLITGEAYLYHSNNNQDRETTLGVNILGKTPLIGINKPSNSQFQELIDIVYERGLLVRKTIDSIDDFYLQQYLRSIFHYMYHDLGRLYEPISDKIGQYKHKFGTRDAVTSRLFMEYAMNNPLTTLKIIGLNFIGLWQSSDILTPNQIIKFNKYLEENHIKDSVHKENIDNHFSVIKSHGAFAKIAKIVLVLLFLATMWLLVYSVSYFIKNKNLKPPIYFVAFILPIMLNGYLLLIAIIINVQARFILIYWPGLMTILFLAMYLLIAKFRKVGILTKYQIIQN